MLKSPEIYIFDTCERLIWEIERYRWDEWTGKSKEKHNAKQKPIDKDDHCIECLGRALFQEPQFFPLMAQPKPATTPGEIPQQHLARIDPFA